jgi:hypothetical protein
MASLQIALLGAPTSLASIMVIGPHHAAVKYVGGGSESGQREHMVRQDIHREVLVWVLCLGAISPRRAKLGGVPRGMRSAETLPPIPVGGPVAGAQLGIEPLDAKRLWLWHHAGYWLVSEVLI